MTREHETMVMAVSDAICAVSGEFCKVPLPRLVYDDMARAALRAIRKPNNRMLNAACAAMSPGKRPTQKRVSEKAKHGIRYRAMIDAALAEGK